MVLRYPSHKISSSERYVAESTTSAAAGSTIPFTDRTLVRLDFSGNGTIDLEAGSEDGQYRILIVQSVLGTTRLENSATVQLNDRAWLPEDAGEALGLLWNAALSKWVELWRSLQYDSTIGVFVKNETGSTIVRGSVVYISGATGNNPLISLASNTTELLSARTIGLVHDNIPHNGFGHVISSGLVDNVNTNGMTSGQSVYLGVSGAFTNVKPVAPNHMVKVGNVIRVSSTIGSIQVWISNGFELDELHDVLITSPTNGQVLTYDSATSLWKNAAGGGSPSIGGTITGGTAGSILFVDPAATIAQDNPNLFWHNANNHLGIGTTTPETKLEIAGAEPYITLPTELTSASPVNPGTDKLILIGQRIANRGMLSVKGAVGHETALQPYMGHNKVAVYSAIPGQATLPAANGISFTTTVGTLTARVPNSTNAVTYMHRYGIVSAATLGALAHQRTGTGSAGAGYFFTGNGTNRGGFSYTVRFAITDPIIITVARMFIGLRNSTAAPTNADPSIVTQQVGIAQYDGTTQLFIVYGGTAAQTPINLGASFIASSTTPYELALYAPSDTANTVYYEVTNLDTGVIATGLLGGTTTTAPGGTILLSGHHWRTNNTSALAVALDICQVYTEMDQ